MQPILEGLIGSLIAGLATGAGALVIFARADWSQRAQILLLASAAGVMLAATMFSLLLPSIDLGRAAGYTAIGAASIAGLSLLLGAGAVWGIHELIPHTHFIKGREGSGGIALGRHWLFVLAITLHNFPEGLSVGVAYGAEDNLGATVAIGIGLQNLPEGLAVAAALIRDGSSRWNAFLVALLTGLVEPLGGLVGAVTVTAIQSLLPWGLGFAAGAMLFVVSGEIIPETHGHGHEHLSSFTLVLGFVGMLLLAAAFS